jgi:ribonuclease D
MSSTTWVSAPEQLRDIIGSIRGRIGLDTEFIRERTYWPQLALVQIAIDVPGAAAPDVVLVDPLAPGMPAVLRDLLHDPSVVKVMHSASEDLVALQHACGAVPEPLFDTQIAAALAGLGAGMGYQRLVQDITGTLLPKGETRSDWIRRPLSDSQLAYATDDVLHLFALHDTLGERLDTLGRRGWFEEDCARMVAAARDEDGERWPHLSLRTSQFLDADAQSRLLRLLRWREAQARSSDRPRSWILDNELAATLARMPPESPEALRALLERHPKAPHKLAGRIWDALDTPLPDEAEAPQARGEERDKRAVRRLQDAVSARSAELGLPDGVLASRRWLELLLDGQDWPGPLGGWRRTQLEPVLTPLLAPAGSVAGAPV